MPQTEMSSTFMQLKQELPPETEQLAREHGAFSRARQVRSPDELLYLVFLYSIADLSVREIAGVCTGSGQRVSDEAVRQRLAACPAWLKAVLGQMLPTSPLPTQRDGWRLVICDGSAISGPGAKGTDYRWHLAYDPVAQQVDQLKFSDAHTSESLTLFDLGWGDLVLGDRHYAKAGALVATRQRGAHLVVRMTTHYLKVWTRQGEPFDLVSALQAALPSGRVSFAVQVCDSKSGMTIPVWIHAHHLNEQQINRARRRVHRKASRNGYTPRQMTLFLSEWVLVLTTIPPDDLSREVILDLYRVRWQVELVIKRYKSLLDAARVRAQEGSPLAEVYLLGKLLGALLVERRARQRLGNAWTQMLGARTATWWRVWKLMAKEIINAVLNTSAWTDWDWRALLRALAERKRKRQLQVIPVAIAQWLNSTPLAAFRRTA